MGSTLWSGLWLSRRTQGESLYDRSAESVASFAIVGKAGLATALLGGFLVALVVPSSTPAFAFSATPAWTTTGGTPVATLTCGTWYVTTLGAQTGRR